MKKIIVLILIFLSSLDSFSQQKVEKTEKEWQEILSPMQFYVLRKQGTERPFTGEFHDHHKKGTFHCAGCNTPLFNSNTKFDSGTGWPSFYTHIDNHIDFKIDNKHGWNRIEIICNTCNGHLGHLFNDGPKDKTGKRYCVNSAALTFQ